MYSHVDTMLNTGIQVGSYYIVSIDVALSSVDYRNMNIRAIVTGTLLPMVIEKDITMNLRQDCRWWHSMV